MTFRFEIVLPIPPSANKIWRRGRFTTYLSMEAVEYKRVVAKAFADSGFVRIDGRVALKIDLYPKCPKDVDKRKKNFGINWADSVRCIDLDNCLKVLIDSLKDIAFGDDKMIWGLAVNKQNPHGDGFVIVSIYPA